MMANFTRPWWGCGAQEKLGVALAGLENEPAGHCLVDGALHSSDELSGQLAVSRRFGRLGICKGAPQCAVGHGCVRWKTG